jgi:hypothetical protein
MRAAPVAKKQATGPRTEQFVPEVDKWGKSVKIWLSLLQREARLKGRMGIEQVWTLIKEADVDLPTINPVAEQFWSLLLSHPHLHTDVVSYAFVKKAHSRRSIFGPAYTMLVDHSFKQDNATMALSWHRRFFGNHDIPRDALQVLSVSASTSKDSQAHQVFRTIYTDLQATCQPCYDHLITHLLNNNKFREALQWHNLLAKINDHPSEEFSNSELGQLMQHIGRHVSVRIGARARFKRAAMLRRAARNLGTQDETSARLTNSATETVTAPSALDKETTDVNGSFFSTPNGSSAAGHADVGSLASSLDGAHPSKRGLISTLITEVQNAGPNGFSDDFCARLYATRALTPSWVSAFIHAFSVKKIGSLALRELALRGESTEDIQYYLEDLRAKGISIGTSRFSRLVKKLAADGDASLLGKLLHDSRYPDSLEDEGMQIRMLDDALAGGDSEGVHQTLTLMSILSEKPQEEYNNILMRSHIRHRRIGNILKLAERMQMCRLKLTVETIEIAMRTLLRPRRFGKRPDMLASEYNYDDLKIVSNIVFRAYEAAVQVPEKTWVELFKRHGMKNLASLERFCHATVNSIQSFARRSVYDKKTRQYGFTSLMLLSHDQHSIEISTRASFPPANPASPIHALLTQRRLQNIVSWGFHDGLRRLVVFRDRQTRLQSRQRAVDSRIARFRRWPSGLTAPCPAQTLLTGVRFLQGLQEKGVHVHPLAVRAVLRQRLWALFGPGRSMKRATNTTAALNPYELVHLLKTANDVWLGSSLFPEVEDQSTLAMAAKTHDSSRDDGFLYHETPTITEGVSNHSPINLNSDDGIGSFEHSEAQDLTINYTRRGNAIDMLINNYIKEHSSPPRNPTEVELQRHTTALMKIFWPSRTIGTGTAWEMKAQKAMLSKEQWLHLLYDWARQMAQRGLTAEMKAKNRL